MPVTTRDQRAACLSVANPLRLQAPVPRGSIGASQRVQLGYAYPEAVGPPLPTTITGLRWLGNKRKLQKEREAVRRRQARLRIERHKRQDVEAVLAYLLAD